MINRNHRDAVIWAWTVIVVIAFLSILSTCNITPKNKDSEDRIERQIDRAITEADRRADERERRQDS